jgi:hypothetical protein
LWANGLVLQHCTSATPQDPNIATNSIRLPSIVKEMWHSSKTIKITKTFKWGTEMAVQNHRTITHFPRVIQGSLHLHNPQPQRWQPNQQPQAASSPPSSPQSVKPPSSPSPSSPTRPQTAPLPTVSYADFPISHQSTFTQCCASGAKIYTTSACTQFCLVDKGNNETMMAMDFSNCVVGVLPDQTILTGCLYFQKEQKSTGLRMERGLVDWLTVAVLVFGVLMS